MLTRSRQRRVVQTIEVSNNHAAIVTCPGVSWLGVFKSWLLETQLEAHYPTGILAVRVTASASTENKALSVL